MYEPCATPRLPQDTTGHNLEVGSMRGLHLRHMNSIFMYNKKIWNIYKGMKE